MQSNCEAVDHYAANNPVKYTDPDGRAIETPWDAFNASLDFSSFCINLAVGNYWGAAQDLVFGCYDVFATATPGLPGGAGAAKLIKRLSVEYGDDAAKLVLKYADDIAELFFKAGNSKTLARNLEKIGIFRSTTFKQAAHHIVAGGSRFAKDTRKILAKYRIDINDAVNGVFLDASKHAGLHTKAYYEKVYELLSKAKTRDEAISILKTIAKDLSEGVF